MLNNFVLVGRIVTMPTKLEKLKIAVARTYKNDNEMYDTDFIEITLTNRMLENTIEYYKVGDIIGVKGRIETNTTSDPLDLYTKKELVLIADKVTFLSSKREEN